jgi:hypothetical protein
MSNHLEDLVGEWLEYQKYFVRKSVLVGKRSRGGFAGELDVVGFNPQTRHLIHIECSLDADPWPKRELRFAAKFERGRNYIKDVFHDIADEHKLDQVALLQFAGGVKATVGGARVVCVADFVSDIVNALAKKHPAREAVPSTWPLVRTLQLAAQKSGPRKNENSLLP